MNLQKLTRYELDAAFVDVNHSNIAIGVRVRRGRAWRPAKWRDDLDRCSTAVPRPRLAGTVVGFTDARGNLVGENSGRTNATDCVTEESGVGWAVVQWDTGTRSVYPVGSMGVHSLVFS
tara:strand:- start:2436 stop:2792 length:357 start_codon:yes stop_codon:yes gene_type:complete